MGRRTCRTAVLGLCAVLWAGTASPQATSSPQPGDLVVAAKGETLYHEPSCPMAKGAGTPAVTTRKKAEQRGLKPHDCRAAGNKALASDARLLVWVDLKTKRYHLPGCSLVGLPRAQVSLAHAKASYTPCNACKPPAK